MAEVTGYARYGLNSRGKFCKHCQQEFVVNILVQTSIGGVEFQDMYDRMHTEKLKRIKKMAGSERVSNPIMCPHSHEGCKGQLHKQQGGLWSCDGICKASFRVEINGQTI